MLSDRLPVGSVRVADGVGSNFVYTDEDPVTHGDFTISHEPK